MTKAAAISRRAQEHIERVKRREGEVGMPDSLKGMIR